MKLLWKTKLDNEPRQMHNLLPALIVGRVNTQRGPKQIVIVTGVSDNIYALDAEKGELLWKHHFETSWTPPVGRPGRGHPVSGRHHRDAGHRADRHAGQIHHLRRRLGRHACAA